MKPKQPQNHSPKPSALGPASPSLEMVKEARKLGVLDPEKPHRTIWSSA